MNFHFPLMPRIFMALAKADRTPIHEILARTPPLPAGCQWATFLRCHDELTLEMVTPAERQFMWKFYAPEPRMRLNLGIRRRLAPLLGGDRRRIELAHSLLLTLTGSPVLYYGDEIGMGDNIWLEDRDGVRTPMQWDAGPNAGFSSADPARLSGPVVDDATCGYRQINVAAQRGDPGSLLNRLREMIRVRKAHPAFGRGDVWLLDADDRAVLAYLRTIAGEKLLIVNNLADAPKTVTLDLGPAAVGKLIDLFTGRALRLADPAPRLTLEGYAYRWLRIEGGEQEAAMTSVATTTSWVGIISSLSYGFNPGAPIP
jgi:maltose alpha-D-glucosyltransferase/alpha-amylase